MLKLGRKADGEKYAAEDLSTISLDEVKQMIVAIDPTAFEKKTKKAAAKKSPAKKSVVLKKTTTAKKATTVKKAASKKAAPKKEAAKKKIKAEYVKRPATILQAALLCDYVCGILRALQYHCG